MFPNLLYLTALCLTIESKPDHPAVNNIPLAQTQPEIDGVNDVNDVDAEEIPDNDAEEADNESENDANVESIFDGDVGTDVDAAAVAKANAGAGAPNPIGGRNGWTGSGLRHAKGRNDHSFLAGESKVAHVGIGFGVVILVIAVVVVSGLAIKRPGSNNASNTPAGLDIE